MIRMDDGDNSNDDPLGWKKSVNASHSHWQSSSPSQLQKDEPDYNGKKVITDDASYEDSNKKKNVRNYYSDEFDASDDDIVVGDDHNEMNNRGGCCDLFLSTARGSETLEPCFYLFVPVKVLPVAQ